MMVTRLISWVKISCSDGGEVGSAEDSINCSGVSFSTGGGKDGVVMKSKDHVVHVILFKQGGNGVIQDVEIEVALNNDLVTFLDPGGQVCFKVFQEGSSWVTIIIVIIEEFLVLFVH